MEGTLPASYDYHFRPENRTLQWQRISAHINKCPRDHRITLEGIARWLELGHVHAAPLNKRRARIHAPADPIGTR